MSREAMEAVQDHSTINDPMGRNVFMAIARFVGGNGSEAWASYRTLAEVAGCDKDTVGRWVGLLQESGELSVRKEGAGRGTRMYYTINLPFDDPKHGGAGRGDNNGGTSPSDGDNSNGDNIERLSQQIELLSQQVELLSQRLELLSPGMSQNVPTRRGQKPETNRNQETVCETDAHDTGGVNGHELPPERQPYGEDQQRFEGVRAALDRVTKNTYSPHVNGAEFDGFALTLVEKGVTEDEVDGFAKWWKEHGFYGGKPALKSVVQEWGNYHSGPNGAQPEKIDMSNPDNWISEDGVL